MYLKDRRRDALLLAGAVALIAWGAAGLYQNARCGFSGGLYTPDYTVPGVFPGSAAAKAGFVPGDRVISVEGIPVEKLGMESRWPRALLPRVGESHRFLVERTGGQVLINMVYEAPSRRVLNRRLAVAFIGFSFLTLGLWAFLTVRTHHALALAQIGLAAGAGASLGLGPNLGSWNGVQGHVSTASTVLMCILLLRFFVMFPKAKPVSRSRLAMWVVYGAWGCFLVFLVLELLVHPALYYEAGTVAYPLMLAYGALTLAAIAHTVVRNPRAEVLQSGMVLILAGLLAAIAALAAAMRILILPGWTYALLITAIPLTMALAVRKNARLTGPGAN